jgi:hypothetical protein
MLNSEFFIDLGDDVAICQIVQQYSRDKYLVSIRKNIYFDTCEKTIQYQIVSRQQLSEIYISFDEAMQFLLQNVDFVDTLKEVDDE